MLARSWRRDTVELVMLGKKLTREDALTHPRIDEFWACIDWLTINDPILHEKVFHAPQV